MSVFNYSGYPQAIKMSKVGASWGTGVVVFQLKNCGTKDNV